MWATGPKRPFAGIWKECPAHKWPEVRKTKAHRTRADAEATDTLTEWYGNDQADAAAKQVAEVALPTASYLEVHDKILGLGSALARQIAHLLAQWPRYHECIQSGAWVAMPPKGSRPATPRRHHRWRWAVASRLWVCSECHRSSRNRRAYPCTGQPPAVQGMAPTQFHASHRVMTICPADEPGANTLYFCTVCGAYAHRKLLQLKAQCPGAAAFASTTLKRMRKGRHPVSDSFIAEPRPWMGALVAGSAHTPSQSAGTQRRRTPARRSGGNSPGASRNRAASARHRYRRRSLASPRGARSALANDHK